MEQISIGSIIKMLWKKFWLIIVAAIICGAVAFGYASFMVSPTYSAKTIICAVSGSFISDNDQLSNQSTYITTGELSTTLALQQSFAGIIDESTDLYEELSSNTHYSKHYSKSELKNAIKVGYNDESILISITVTVPNPDDAILIANDVATLSSKYIMSTIARTNVTTIRDADYASRTSPNVSLMTIIGAMGGILVVSFLIILINVLDHTIKGEEDFRQEYDIPLIGFVPNFDECQSGKVGYYSEN